MVRLLVILLALALISCNQGNAISLTASPALPTPVLLASPTEPQPALVEVSVFFTDSKRYQSGQTPFEAPVTRLVDPSAGLLQAVLAEFFRGPTEAERAWGLERIDSGFTGFSRLEVEGGIARVYLTGECRSLGATYTIAQPVLANLRQFPEIQAVKIYDADGVTEEPDGLSNSIPFCLEP